MATVLNGYRRAAVCIGVDRVQTLPILKAAASGASAVAAWAQAQGCDTALHTDSDRTPVTRRAIFESIRDLVNTQQYNQLLIYFAGHGVVLTAGTETWLLSDAASDPAEAINMLLTAEYARSAGIKHVVLISDACRTSARRPFNLTGLGVFPLNQDTRADDADIDTYFATSPGKEAYEVKPTTDQPGYGIFTHCLLNLVAQPPRDIIEYIDATTYPALCDTTTPNVPVLTSRGLKQPLIDAVVDHSATIRITLDQRPQIRAETALPQFFATVDADHGGSSPHLSANHSGDVTSHRNLWRNMLAAFRMRRSLRGYKNFDAAQGRTIEARSAQMHDDFRTGGEILDPDPRHNETESVIVSMCGTGIDSISALGWELADRGRDENSSWMELVPAAEWHRTPGSAIVQFTDGTGTVLVLAPGTTITVVARHGRVDALEYRTEGQYRYGSDRTAMVEAILAAQDGDLEKAASALRFERRVRGGSTSGPMHATNFIVSDTISAYGAAEQRLQRRLRLGQYYAARRSFLISFDLALLTSRTFPSEQFEILGDIRQRLVHPLMPLMTRGWLLLADDPPVARLYHQDLARHLIPALFTTLEPAGVEMAAAILMEDF
ncbi:hypothetical protein GFY24_28310 [Nocardia sp. SYP-A9097]|uniref:caspase family protein n=1 Tax=Nocardia sp. SYP-A9097 TaxID=2663237 RepID=UPI00129B66A1|nr:caspase family protein [Nocardia sp. SYP-A9097]MRH91301.1 hypothetical protein [Nocardia sp. SYP-A9097]